MRHASMKIRVVIVIVAALMMFGAPARRVSHLVLRHSVCRRMTADVVSSPGAFSPFALASVVLPALLCLNFLKPASAGLNHELNPAALLPITRPPPPRPM